MGTSIRSDLTVLPCLDRALGVERPPRERRWGATVAAPTPVLDALGRPGDVAVARGDGNPANTPSAPSGVRKGTGAPERVTPWWLWVVATPASSEGAPIAGHGARVKGG